jgi:peptide/nickel transport system substrate-binding protein
MADNFLGATPILKTTYGDGNGGPSKDKAAQILSAAGVSTPVTIKLQYNPDHYGASSSDEYAAVKSQLESSGLFTVDLQSTEWVQYSKDRVADVYPVYQLGWFPDFLDSDNYLTPFFTKDNFVHQHYTNPELQALISAEATEPDQAKRKDLLNQIQQILAHDVPTLPLLQGKQILITGPGVTGGDMTIVDASRFRMNLLGK